MPRDQICRDCGALPGQAHEDECDVARCLATGRQRLMCDGPAAHPGRDCGHDVWTGRWPGEAECEEFGWWVQNHIAEGLGWVPCAPDAPGAQPDVNRLVREAEWDPDACRWRLKASAS